MRSDGRFEMHELLRQFAAEQLAADPALVEEVSARHSAFFLAFLAGREGRLRGHDQRAAGAEIARDGANVQAAWRWAIEHGEYAAVDRALTSCFIAFFMRSRFQEGDELFSLAAQIAPDTADEAVARLGERVRTRALLRRAAFRYFLGDYDAALRDAGRGLADAHSHDIPGEVACANITLGAIAGWRGDADLAHRRLERALAIGHAIGDQHLIADALLEQSHIHGSYGDYPAAQRLAQQSLTISRAAGQVDWVAHALLALGWATVCLGEYADAEAHFRESQQLFEQIGSSFGAAQAEGFIGWVAWCVGGARLGEARARIERSLSATRAIGHRLSLTNYLGDLALIAIDSCDYSRAWEHARAGLAIAREFDSAIYIAYHLSILGHVASARGEFDAGRRYLGEALRTTVQTGLLPQLAFCLYHTAALLAREAAAAGADHPAYAPHIARALELLASLAAHPAAWHVYRARAERLIDELRRCLPAAAVEAALARGRRLDWKSGVGALLAELAHAEQLAR
jgi:tetratricopeptide (TPR) repeat protein